MKRSYTFTLSALLLLGTAACQDFLSGGELSHNPNVAVSASPQNLFTATQVALWNELGGDMSRVTSMWAQHITGAAQQYLTINDYAITPATTGGFHQGLYIQGGLIDLRNLEQATRTVHDSLFLGITQVEEAWLMGEGADLFGALVYSHALTGEANPPLDSQTVVYAHVEALLDTAINNMSASGNGNFGPEAVDLAYGGDPQEWIKLAHTLKARFYMHQIHAPGVTAAQMSDSALTQVAAGLQAGDDYNAVWSGNAGEQNYWYGFNVVGGRSGYYVGGTTLIDSLFNRQDSALVYNYFEVDTAHNGAISYPNLAPARLQPNAPQTFASNVENLLLWAEAAYRTGDVGTARTKLIAARTAEGVVNPAIVPLLGAPLLQAILEEKWISDFELGSEAWTDYRRTCTPNFQPAVNGGKVPGRLFYDDAEQQTNTSIPPAGQGVNGSYTQAQPLLSTSDGDGASCLAF